MKLILSTWLVADEVGQETEFPQNKGRSSSWKFQEVYWKCIVVYFFTARKFHPEAGLTLFLNTAPSLSAMVYVEIVKKYGVEVVVVPFTKRPPSGFSKSFGNQFYIFDIVEYIASRSSREGWYVLDSDCVFTRSGMLLDTLEKEASGILTFDCKLSEFENINGVTRRQLTTLGAEEGWFQSEHSIPYCGGEFFAASTEALAASSQYFNMVREKCIQRWINQKKTVTEEAHVLSLVYAGMGIKIGTANVLIKRIWTTFKYNNVNLLDAALPIWHLPSEKRTGLSLLYDDIRKYAASDKSNDWWGGRLRKRCGIPKRGFWKLITDFNYKIGERLWGRTK